MLNAPDEDATKQLKSILRDLSNRSPILGAAIFSVEGLPLVSYFHAGIEEASIAAMVASIQSVGELAVKELRQGDLKSIIIQGTLGTTVVISIPDSYLLAVTAPENVKLGLVFNDAKVYAKKMSGILRNLR
ncbi:MAG: roadblock/LC7 domain-containing protein [Candidatus Thorarchaeota archaeon]|nr:roadblock/LC7 domain-containing protein [Candidatus Thorarchaeota archaeon]